AVRQPRARRAARAADLRRRGAAGAGGPGARARGRLQPRAVARGGGARRVPERAPRRPGGALAAAGAARAARRGALAAPAPRRPGGDLAAAGAARAARRGALSRARRRGRRRAPRPAPARLGTRRPGGRPALRRPAPARRRRGRDPARRARGARRTGRGSRGVREVVLSLVSHTNVGKTTLARTLLRRDVGEVFDHAHVTEETERHPLLEVPPAADGTGGGRVVLADNPGFGDSTRLLGRLRGLENPVGWLVA